MQSDAVEKIVRDAVQKALAENTRVTQVRTVTLQAAQALVARVFEAAEQMRLSVFAAVADSGGNPVMTARMDGAILASYDIAHNKAYTAVALRMSTDKLAALAAPGGELYGIQHTNGGKIVVFGGGQPLWCNGQVVGGLGVSGGTLEQDIALAQVGKKYWEDVLCR